MILNIIDDYYVVFIGTWLLLFAEKMKRPWLKMAYQGSSLDDEKSSVSALRSKVKCINLIDFKIV